MADNNRHKCKLCSRTFSNGRSLGGHMKAHLASLPPLPSPPSPSPSSSSFSSSSFSSQEKPLSNYVLQKKRTRNPTRIRTHQPEPDATEEDVAMWLVLLSRDKWKKGFGIGEIKGRRCDTCRKTFRSSRALETHKNICSSVNINDNENNKIFECPFCYKVFGSGQALGGHKRSHLVVPSSNNVVKDSFIDLNLPAPADDEEISVVSNA